MLQLAFNPGLTLTGFRTTRPVTFSQVDLHFLIREGRTRVSWKPKQKFPPSIHIVSFRTFINSVHFFFVNRTLYIRILCVGGFCVHDVLLLINKCFIMVYCHALKRCSVSDADNFKYSLRLSHSLIFFLFGNWNVVCWTINWILLQPMRFNLSNDALKIKKNELAERQRVMNEKNIQRAERKTTNEKESGKICSY